MSDTLFFDDDKKEIVEIVHESWTIKDPENYFNEVYERWEKLEYEELEKEIEKELKIDGITEERKRELMMRRFELLRKIKN